LNSIEKNVYNVVLQRIGLIFSCFFLLLMWTEIEDRENYYEKCCSYIVFESGLHLEPDKQTICENISVTQDTGYWNEMIDYYN
jgi:hypothetical protein